MVVVSMSIVSLLLSKRALHSPVGLPETYLCLTTKKLSITNVALFEN